VARSHSASVPAVSNERCRSRGGSVHAVVAVVHLHDCSKNLFGAPELAQEHLVICRGFPLARHRRDGELLRVLIEDQLQPADVPAIHAVRLRCSPVVTDLRLAGWTFPRHVIEFLSIPK